MAPATEIVEDDDESNTFPNNGHDKHVHIDDNPYLPNGSDLERSSEVANLRPSVFSCGSSHHTPPMAPLPISELQPLSNNNSTSTTPKCIATKSHTSPPSEPFIIGITGASASGKTTVCRKIIDGLGDQRCVLISVDWFYRGLPKDTDASNYNFDHPSAFDFQSLHETLIQMKKRQLISVPAYNFALHKRDDNKKFDLDKADVIIVEGILTFYDPNIRNMMHMKVFVDEDADICLTRRIQRDIKSRGRTIESILEQYRKFVKPSFEEFILPTKTYADMIMPRGSENVIMIDMIIKHIALKIRQDDLRKLYSGLIVMTDSFQTRGLHTIIRNINTTRDDIVFYSNRLMRLLVEEGLGLLPFKRKSIKTANGGIYCGVGFIAGLAAISLLPDGATMESSLRAVCNTVRIGKMVIDGKTNMVTYEKLPNGLDDRYILVLAPVLNSGCSCEKAVERLVQVGCKEDHIFLLTLVTAPQAVIRICSRFPKLRLIVSAVDIGLDENGLVYPGIGDFSTRYFGTD